MATDDAELLEQWRAGDDNAGMQLLRRHFDALFRFFHNKVGDAAEDLTQQTMLSIVRSRDRFEGRSSFRTFLFAVARNELFAHFRSARRKGERFDPMTHSVCDTGTSPSSALVRDDEKRQVSEALAEIPVDLQIALELHYWEGMSGTEIARVLELPSGTAKSRIRRAKEALRAVILARRDSGLQIHPALNRLAADASTDAMSG